MATETDGTAVETPVLDVNDTDIDAFADEFFAKPEPKAAKTEATKEEKSTDGADAVETEKEPEAEAAEPVEEVEEEVEAEEPTAEDDEPEDEFKPKHKNRKPARERISELTAERKAAEARAIAAEQELARLRAERQNPQPRQEQQEQPVRKAVDPAAPDPNALNDKGEPVYPLGEFDPQYVADNTRFTIRKEMEEQRAQEEQARAERAEQEQMTALQTEWAGKLTAAEADFDDLRPTIASLEGQLRDVPPELGTYLAQTIMQMEVGPQVLYYLANHPDEANEIVAAGPVGATLKLGKLEAKVEAALAKRRAPKDQQQAAPVRQTRAPDPAPANRGRGSLPSVRGDTDDLDAFEQVFFKKKK